MPVICRLAASRRHVFISDPKKRETVRHDDRVTDELHPSHKIEVLTPAAHYLGF